MTQFRDIAIIIPLFNEMEYIDTLTANLSALEAPIPFKVFFVDGGSDDGTLRFLEELQAPYSYEILHNPDRLPAGALNVGISASTQELVVRIDGHTGFESDYLVNVLDVFDRHPDIGATGASLINCGQGKVGRIIAPAMSSHFGMGGVAGRVGADREMDVDSVAFACFRREVIDKVGLYDLSLPYSEDDEYNFRATQLGYRILYSPLIEARYYVRESFRGLLSQMWQYGRGKVRTLFKHRSMSNLRQMAPPMFVIYLLLLPLLLAESQLALIPLAAWFLLALLFAIRAGGRTFPGIVWAFLLMHLGYGAGYLQQLIAQLIPEVMKKQRDSKR